MTIRVRLREVRDDDIAIFYEQQRDPKYVRMAAFTSKDPSDREAFDAHWVKIRSDENVVIQTIIVGDEVLGSVASFVMFDARQVTYGVSRDHWGQGIATTALRLFLAEIERRRPLEARAASDNLGSLRVLEKCGFRVTGRERAFADGRGEEIEETVLRLD